MTAPDYPTFNRRGFRMYQGQNGLAPSFTYRGGRYRIRPQIPKFRKSLQTKAKLANA